jgi:hypothetical protein
VVQEDVSSRLNPSFSSSLVSFLSFIQWLVAGFSELLESACDEIVGGLDAIFGTAVGEV